MQHVQNVFLGGCHSNENLKHLTHRYRLMFKNEFAQNIHLLRSSHQGEYAKIVACYKQTSELIMISQPAEFTHAELFSAIATVYCVLLSRPKTLETLGGCFEGQPEWTLRS